MSKSSLVDVAYLLVGHCLLSWIEALVATIVLECQRGGYVCGCDGPGMELIGVAVVVPCVFAFCAVAQGAGWM